jgi:hypothetical protein
MLSIGNKESELVINLNVVFMLLLFIIIITTTTTTCMGFVRNCTVKILRVVYRV